MRILLPLLLWGCEVDDLDSTFTPSFLGEHPCDGSPIPDAIYCDEENHGGGWLLVAKVFPNPSPHGTSTPRSEPRDFWQAGVEATSLGDPDLPARQFPDSGIAAFGLDRLPLTEGSLLRIEMVHANGSATQEWFKEIEEFEDLENWFGPAAGQEEAMACRDPELETGCTKGKIVVNPNGRLWFQGLRVPGSSAVYGIHMNLDFTNGIDYDGVCSDTSPEDLPTWPFTANADHWGHGMRIWIR